MEKKQDNKQKTNDKVTWPPSAAVAQSGAATAANIAGKGCGVAFSAVALRVIRNPAVADIHFRKDRQRDVNAQLGEPLRKRPVEQCDGAEAL